MVCGGQPLAPRVATGSTVLPDGFPGLGGDGVCPGGLWLLAEGAVAPRSGLRRCPAVPPQAEACGQRGPARSRFPTELFPPKKPQTGISAASGPGDLRRSRGRAATSGTL